MRITNGELLFQYNLFEESSLDSMVSKIFCNISFDINYIVKDINQYFQAQKVNIYHSNLKCLRNTNYSWRTWTFMDCASNKQIGNLYTSENLSDNFVFLKKAFRKSVKVGPKKIVQIKDKKLFVVNLEEVISQETAKFKFEKHFEELSIDEVKTLNRHMGQKYDKSLLQEGYLINNELIMKRKILAFDKLCKFEECFIENTQEKIIEEINNNSEDESKPFELIPTLGPYTPYGYSF